VDPSQFVSAAGAWTFTAGPSEWEIDTFANELRRQTLAANRVDIQSVTPSDSDFVTLHPLLPTAIAGKATRVRAVTICLDATHASIALDHVFIRTYHGPLSGGADPVVATFEDGTNRDDSVCRRYDLPATFVLGASDYLSVSLRLAWTAASAEVQLSGTTFELERT
jgi:hypothetical protein